jgi:hypothetical protein
VESLPRALSDWLPPQVRDDIAGRAIALSDLSAERIDPAKAADRWVQHWARWWDEAVLETKGVI